MRESRKKLKIFIPIILIVVIGIIVVLDTTIAENKLLINIKEISRKIVETTANDAKYSITKSGTTTYYDTLNDAVAATVDGDTIVVVKDVEDNSTVVINNTITLDTAGHTITRTNNIGISTTGSLTISGKGTITRANDCVIFNKGNFILKGATLKSTTNTSTGLAKGIYNEGKVTIESGTIEVNSENKTATGIESGIESEVTIKGGSITATSTEGEAKGIYNAGKLTIGDETKEISTQNPYIYGTTLAVESANKDFNFYNGKLDSDGEKIYTGNMVINDETVVENTESGIVLKKAIATEIISEEKKLSNKSEITYIIKFKTSVTGFEQSDIQVENGTIKSFNANEKNDEYTIIVSNTGTCVQTIKIEGGVCKNANEVVNEAAQYSIQIDKDAPTVEEIIPNGNTTWSKTQEIAIKVKDNITSEEKIIIEYTYYNDGKAYKSDKVTNGEKIKLEGVTGKYILVLQTKDEAGNISKPVVTREFYMDGSITKLGEINATFEDNTKAYEFKEITELEKYDDKYEETIEGDYTTQNIYVTVGSEGEDAESGIKSVTYQLYTIDEKGNVLETLIAEPTKSKTLLEDAAKYKLVLTTIDNCGNSAKINYIINKEKPEVILTPEKTNGYVKEQKIKVQVNKISEGTTIYYSFANEKAEIEKINNWTQIENGKEIEAKGLNGKYNLVLKIEYPTGETEFIRKGIYYFDNSIDKVASLIAKINNANGEDYKDYTNKNVYIKIADDAKDISGITKSSYEIINEKEEVIANGSSIATKIETEGFYIVRVTSEDSIGNKKTEEHEIKIDRTSPEVKFDGSSDYIKNGMISVQIQENGKNASGLKEDSMRFYWTRNTDTPKKDDFYGSENEGYTGKINSTNQSIVIPEGISGIWYLWIYAEDNCNNVAIKSNVKIENDGNISYLDNEPPIAGKIKATIDGTIYSFKEENNKYSGSFTNKNVKIELVNGYDADSGVKSNKYTIKKDNSTIYTGSKEYTIKKSGIYTIIVETEDNKSNKSQREYEVRIDNQTPSVDVDQIKNEEYAKVHTIKIDVEDNLSGIKNKSYHWVTYNPDSIVELDNISPKMSKAIVGGLWTESFFEDLINKGFIVTKAEEKDGTISTPSDGTGKYLLFIDVEDNCGNRTCDVVGPYYIDNTNPTKPEVQGVITELVGTKDGDVVYYGEMTNKLVTVTSYGSYSLSGVDKYQVTYTTDSGKKWTEWKDCTKEVEEEILGTIEVNNHGKTILKFRGISVLKDGENYGQESQEYVVVQDKKGPKITFDVKNITNEKLTLTVSVTDDNVINENSLEYAWYKKEDNKDIAESEINKLKFTSFINGADIVTPEGAEETYILVVKAEDIYGNQTIGKSEEYILTQDKKGPEITFDVNEKFEKSINVKVSVSVTDDSSVNENSLKYAWYKKETTENITETEINKLTFTSFINGAEIVSTEGLDGKYVLLVKAEDIYGNETIKESGIYYIGEKTTNYKIENKKIYNVSPKTTAEVFIKNIKNEILGTDYKVYNKSGAVETDIVKTGEKLIIDGREYTIIVSGDVNGDGLVTVSDLSAVKKTIVGKKELSSIANMAGDINGDGIITIIDLSKIKKAIVGKIML